jgi:hypothetical protein
VPFPSPKVWRNPAAVAVALGVSLLKPTSMLARVEPVTITAIPIDFDRDNPEHKQFRKLVWRSRLNLFANSSNFGGYSALAVDASRSLTATPRKAPPTSLSSATIASCPFTRDHFGPPDGALPLPAEAKRMDPNRGIEAVTPIRAGKLKGTMVVFSERLLDKRRSSRLADRGPTPGPITLKNIGGFDITDATSLPDGGIVLLEQRFRYSEGVKMRIRRVSAKELKPGALIAGEVLLEANDSLNIDNMEGISVHQSSTRRDDPNAHLR